MKVQRWKNSLAMPWLLYTAAVFSADTPYVEDLSLGVQKQLDFSRGIQKIAIADDAVVHVALERSKGKGHPAKILLTPLKVGSTSLMVWEQKDAPPVSYLLQVSPSVRGQQYEQLTEMVLREAALRGGKEKATELNSSHLIQKSNVVQVDVKIVEINKEKLKQAGLNIFSTGMNSQGFSFGVFSPGTTSNPNFSASGAVTGIQSSPFSQAFGLLMNFSKAKVGVNLGMLEGSGMARVLAQPSLLAVSGQSANFLAGGEVPIPVAQGNGAINIEYKSYGVGLTVAPTILENDRIVLKVSPESSELDYANAVVLQSVSVPAISVRKADTTVELGDGESFVIGGLVSQNIMSNVNRVPLLSQIPILGTMFKRQEFSKKERELVIVVTPRLVKPLAKNVPLDAYLPGAEQAQRAPSGFWSSYVGPSGNSDQVPGFSQ